MSHLRKILVAVALVAVPVSAWAASGCPCGTSCPCGADCHCDHGK